MTEWYHYLFRLSFATLILQNILIPASILIDNIGIRVPYFFDLFGFSILAIATFSYFIVSKDKFVFLSGMVLSTWVILRIYIQFFLVPNIEISTNADQESVLSQVSSDLTLFSTLFLISGILLVMYALFQQLASSTNLPLLLVYVFTNFLAVVIVAFAFIVQSSLPLEEQISNSSLGIVLKLVLVPIVGAIAFATMFMRTEKIYNIEPVNS